jgi:hypothetical protein
VALPDQRSDALEDGHAAESDAGFWGLIARLGRWAPLPFFIQPFRSDDIAKPSASRPNRPSLDSGSAADAPALVRGALGLVVCLVLVVLLFRGR